MKKLFAFLVIGVFLYGQEAILMPPAMPKVKNLKEQKNKNDPCNVIPPMLIYLPPALEKDLDKCKNSFYKPSLKKAKDGLKKIFKKDIKIKEISTVEGFNMLYKIKTDIGNLYCNKRVDHCLKFSEEVVK